MADAPHSSATGPAQLARQLGGLWSKQPRGRKLAAIAVVILVLGGVGWTSLAHHAHTWTPLAEGSSPDDAAELYALLQSRDVPARLREGKLEVATDRADEARAIAASAGLPRAGKGFELFDGASLGQSSFTEQVNFRRALQGELARSIAALAQVDSARVHLALGKHSVFKDQDEAPSASVAVHLHPGQQLTAEQVRGVRQLVTASVEGLKPDAVAIVDNHGNLLDASEPGAANRKATIEHDVAARVREMLERVVGAGKVSVVATADVDERKTSETEDIFDKDRAAVRSESRTVDGADAVSAVGGIAGTRGNLPGTPTATTQTGSGAPSRLQESRTYEVSHTVRQIENAPAQLVRLHVAVLVDDKLGPDGKPVVRDDKEMTELVALARQAAGIDDARGDKLELHAIAFAPKADTAAADVAPPAAPGLPLVPIAIGAGGALFVVIVALAMMMRRARKRQRATAQQELPSVVFPVPVAELERAVDAGALPTGAATADARGLPPGKPTSERVAETVAGDIERAAAVLTAWLAEPAARTLQPGAK